VNTGQYATYYVAYCMEGLRDYAGWDLKTLATLPFMVWVRRIEIDFLRPVRGDQEITISSFVRDFRGPGPMRSSRVPWSTPLERRSPAAS
jgi:acyl-CoA thioester hydrolase